MKPQNRPSLQRVCYVLRFSVPTVTKDSVVFGEVVEVCSGSIQAFTIHSVTHLFFYAQ